MNRLISVLVVDDDQVDRLALKRALDKSEINHELTEANNAHEAFHLLKNHKFDCVFLDYLLPGTDGLTILREIRAEGINIPIIVVTSQGDEAIAVEMMKAGAADYVVKDHINPNSVNKIIQSVINLKEVEEKREEAEGALRESEFRLKQAQRIAKIGNWEYNFKTHEVFWSPEMYNILEIDPEGFIPKREHFLTMFHPDDGPLITRNLVLEDSETPFNKDLRVRKPDGSYKHVNMQTHFQYDDNGVLEKFIGTVQDIDERKKFERELIEAKHFAEESGKIKEQFLANMSHEIRTPMNAIIGFANLIMDEPENLSDTQKENIKAIHDAGEHLLVIINDILDFSKIESGKLILEELDFNIHGLAKNVIHLFEAKAIEKKIELSCNLSPEIPHEILGDPVRLNQVLVNLISNAIKFTENGFVKLSVRVKDKKKNIVVLEFVIEDSGIGIPHEKRESIFESFTQASNDTTRKYGGTGLGLSIVKRIVEIQKGEISVESVEGIGTTFKVIIPFHINHHASSKIMPSSDSLINSKNYPSDIRVLMAEDNELNQVLARSIFKKIGWYLDIVGNGREVIRLIQQHSYDIILMDIQMPELDGHQTTRMIRQEMSPPLSQIPIIALTAHAMQSEVERCRQSGMNDIISKPFKFDELAGKILFYTKRAIAMYEPRDEKANSGLVDFERLKRLSIDGLVSLIQIFLEKTPAQLDIIAESLIHKNWKQLKNACHRLKSSYGVFGVSRSLGHLESMERICLSGEIDEKALQGNFKMVLEENERLVQELTGKLETLKNQTSTE